MKISSTVYGLIASKLTGNPFYVRYQATYRCNYACRMCGQRQMDFSGIKELSIPEVEKMAARLAHMSARHIVITGGEPFMRKDLPAIISVFKKNHFSIRLQTNGGPQVSRQRLQECVAAGLNDISVSIDTLNSSAQDEICQREGVVAHALATLDLARELLPGGVSQANIVVSRFNFEELPFLVRYFHDRGVYTYLTPVMVISERESASGEYNFRSPDDTFTVDGFSSEIHHKVIGELIELRRAGFGLTNSTKFLRDYLAWLDQRDLSWRCEAGSISLDILPDGGVTVCKEKEPYANILDPEFEKRFHSLDYRKYAREVSTACSGCFYGEYREPQYALRDNVTLWEWTRDWFRIFRHGMKYNLASNE